MGNTRVIVAGIGTDVGKTVISAILARALEGHYWKPVQCGLPSDRDWIQEIAGVHCHPDAICLKTPCSPHLAARHENMRIEAKKLIPPSCEKPLVIEGTGGLLAPLNEKEVWFDAAVAWETKWVLVHRHYLGSLNHFLLTLDFLEKRNIPIEGVVFNGEGDLETEKMLLEKAKTRCLGRLSWQPQLTRQLLHKIAEEWRPTVGL